MPCATYPAWGGQAPSSRAGTWHKMDCMGRATSDPPHLMNLLMTYCWCSSNCSFMSSKL